uniref:Dynactin subunit 2 n=1 Tax=Rhabditophanes sp. KR3021 TaxID=114890 RepID=A0AC35UGV0_9BILA
MDGLESLESRLTHLEKLMGVNDEVSVDFTNEIHDIKRKLKEKRYDFVLGGDSQFIQLLENYEFDGNIEDLGAKMGTVLNSEKVLMNRVNQLAEIEKMSGKVLSSEAFQEVQTLKEELIHSEQELDKLFKTVQKLASINRRSQEELTLILGELDERLTQIESQK